MPTIPLYSVPDDPNASHSVMSPGGYEFWKFDIQAPSNGERFIVMFYDGCWKLASYQRRYRAFSENPTKVAPPLPRDFAAIGIEAREIETVTHIASSDVRISADRLDIAMDRSSCVQEASGAIRMILHHARIMADIDLRPLAKSEFIAAGKFTIDSNVVDLAGGYASLEHRFGTSPASAITGR